MMMIIVVNSYKISAHFTYERNNTKIYNLLNNPEKLNHNIFKFVKHTL